MEWILPRKADCHVSPGSLWTVPLIPFGLEKLFEASLL